MAKYIYSKFSLVKTYIEVEVSPVVDESVNYQTIQGYGDYEISQSNGFYSAVGGISFLNSNPLNLFANTLPVSQNSYATQGLYRKQYTRNGNFVRHFTNKLEELKERGSFLEDVVAEDGTYPLDGYSGDFWYVRGERHAPELFFNINGAVKEMDSGWVNINGELREIDKMWTRIDDVLREV